MDQEPENNQVPIGSSPSNDNWYVSEPEEPDSPLARVFSAIMIAGICSAAGGGVGFFAFVRGTRQRMRLEQEYLDASPTPSIIIYAIIGLIVGIGLAFVIDRTVNSSSD